MNSPICSCVCVIPIPTITALSTIPYQQKVRGYVEGWSQHSSSVGARLVLVLEIEKLVLYIVSVIVFVLSKLKKKDICNKDSDRSQDNEHTMRLQPNLKQGPPGVIESGRILHSMGW